jgi:hypothetical protein
MIQSAVYDDCFIDVSNLTEPALDIPARLDF